MSDVKPSIGAGAPCLFSILIGRVSTEDEGRILETLDAIASQQASFAFEIIIADRRNGEISQTLLQRFPNIHLLTCNVGTPLPKLLALALDHAAGDYIVVTEDHCLPPENWLEAFERAFREASEDVAAVGGAVENGLTRSALDWATFLCEYGGFLPPVPEGPAASLPGMNIAYRRSALQSIDRSLLVKGFWETTIHPVLRRGGWKLYSTNRVMLRHCKKFSFGHFIRQRFAYSRYYAGLRFPPEQIWRRIAAFCLSVILPAMLLGRLGRRAWTRTPPLALLAALPALVVFVTVWAVGEMVGYLRGAGDAMARLE